MSDVSTPTPNPFWEAFAAFQRELPRIEQTARANAGKFSYSYAPLDVVAGAVLPLLAKHNLVWSCYTDFVDGQFMLNYSLSHPLVDYGVSGVFPLPPVTTPPQQMGSALTYAKRYALLTVTGVAPGGEDNDAAGVGGVMAPSTVMPSPAQTLDANLMRALQDVARELGLSGDQVLAFSRKRGFTGPVLSAMTTQQAEGVLSDLRARLVQADAVRDGSVAGDDGAPIQA